MKFSLIWDIMGGGIRLIVGFQPLMVISLTVSWIRWCMQVYACELMWTCLVWAECSMPDSFWVPGRILFQPTFLGQLQHAYGEHLAFWCLRSLTAGRGAKWGDIWDSGLLIACIWGTFDLIVLRSFGIIL